MPVPPEAGVTPVPPEAGVTPVPPLTIPGLNVLNPRFWLNVETKLLNPVPKLVLNALGAWPKPMNPRSVPVANPLLKPLLKLLPLNSDPNGLVNPLIGRVKFDWPVIPKNEPSGL